MLLLNVARYDGLEQFTHMPFLASFNMSEEEEEKEKKPVKPATPPSMGKDWGSGSGSGRSRLFENPDDFDIFCDRENNMNYIFHAGELNCTIDFLEYDPETQRITVHTNDHQQLDLGAKIQWLIRPYIAREQDLFIIRTKNGQAIDGVEVHLQIKNPQTKNTLN